MILVLGKNGQVASELKILATNEFYFSSKEEINLLRPDAIIPILNDLNPRLIINCTAYNQVDSAEIDPIDSFLINAESLKKIGEFSYAKNCPVIHISTDFVFDGLNGPYDENSIKNPINKYGESKSQGEEYLLDSVGKLLIIRTSWVYSNFGSNFFKAITHSFKNNKEIYGAVDVIGSPTRAFTIAKFIYDNYENFLHNDFEKIYHLCDSGLTSKYEFICSIISKISYKFELPNVEIKKVTNNFFTLPALRPLNSGLINRKISNDFKFKINDWESELDQEVERLTV